MLFHSLSSPHSFLPPSLPLSLSLCPPVFPSCTTSVVWSTFLPHYGPGWSWTCRVCSSGQSGDSGALCGKCSSLSGEKRPQERWKVCVYVCVYVCVRERGSGVCTCIPVLTPHTHNTYPQTHTHISTHIYTHVYTCT